MGVAIWPMMVREGLTGERYLSLEGSEEDSHVERWGKNVTTDEAASAKLCNWAHLEWSGNSKKARVIGKPWGE